MIHQGLNTLRQAKVIDEDIYQGMLAVVEQLQQHCQCPLPTHGQCTNALPAAANRLTVGQRNIGGNSGSREIGSVARAQ